MAGKRTNALRAYHLLVVRVDNGFAWQIRYDRHANPVEQSAHAYRSHIEATQAGEAALMQHRSTEKNGA